MDFEKYKRYKSARALANAILNGSTFYTGGVYYLTTNDDADEAVAVLDTSGPEGPESGIAWWAVFVHPHPWAQEIAEMIWDGLDWHEVGDENQEPSASVCTTGWFCRMRVHITPG